MLTKVISGGQTGVDRAGLEAARICGLETGGWMPKGYRALDGNMYHFSALYNIQEHTSPKYPPRTATNVRDSDGTLRIAWDWESAGERLTLKMIQQYKRPYHDVLELSDVAIAASIRWMAVCNITILNVAGNSERTAPGIERRSYEFLCRLFAIAIDQLV